MLWGVGGGWDAACPVLSALPGLESWPKEQAVALLSWVRLWQLFPQKELPRAYLVLLFLPPRLASRTRAARSCDWAAHQPLQTIRPSSAVATWDVAAETLLMPPARGAC